MSAGRRWVVATGNRGKLAEIRALLEGTGLELVAQHELGIRPAEETAATFVENALQKARHAAREAGLPAIADDSGLIVDALDGAPGIRSARFAGEPGDDARNLDKVLAALRGVPEPERTARFYCVVVALADPADPTPLIAEGVWAGRIAERPAGAGGFGYDPIFIDPLLGVTAAELPKSVKNEVSHRAVAMRRLAAAIRSQRASAVAAS
ncbi:MAG TPA: RdgB/HAM1 family non-canonical purine NTP pyrophosphatase [Gammaproteobacteria bacterium]|nr:RdgB/HAM1 family non-canonical purine NTP pyrophosphatase [Gammaproteobacteria bacterium]